MDILVTHQKGRASNLLKTYQQYVLSCPQLGHNKVCCECGDENIHTQKKYNNKSRFAGANSHRPERKLKDTGEEFQHTCGVRGVTELCAGNLIINAIITNFLKVIILLVHNPHTQAQKRAWTWSSTRATPLALFFSPPPFALPFIVRVNSWCPPPPPPLPLPQGEKPPTSAS